MWSAGHGARVWVRLLFLFMPPAFIIFSLLQNTCKCYKNNWHWYSPWWHNWCTAQLPFTLTTIKHPVPQAAQAQCNLTLPGIRQGFAPKRTYMHAPILKFTWSILHFSVQGWQLPASETIIGHCTPSLVSRQVNPTHSDLLLSMCQALLPGSGLICDSLAQKFKEIQLEQ